MVKKSNKLASQTKINLEAYTPGVYVVKFDYKQKTVVKQFVKL